MGIQYDLVAYSTTTSGTGTITVGSALTGSRTPAGASIPDGTPVSYSISSNGGAARETGVGVVGGGGTTMTRSLRASTTGSLLNLSGTSEVYLTVIASDLNANLAPTLLRPNQGVYHVPSIIGATANSLTVSAAGDIYAAPIVFGAPTTINRVGMAVITGAGTNGQVGIYTNHPTLNVPHQRLAADTVGVSTSGDKEYVVSLSLDPDTYWLVLTCDGTPTLRSGALGSSSLGWAASSGSVARGLRSTGSYATLPTDLSGSSWATHSLANVFAPWVRSV